MSASLKRFTGRALVTLGVIVAYRVGCAIPLPGLYPDRALRAASNPEGSLLSLFGGGPLTTVSLFALGIMPFITASILVSLLSAIPGRLHDMKSGTPDERRRVAMFARLLGLAIAMVNAFVLVRDLATSELDPVRPGGWVVAVFTSVLIGYGICLWFAELGTRYGLMNGGTTLIVTSTAALVGTSLDGVNRGSGLASVFALAAIGLVGAYWLSWAHLSFRVLPVRTARVPATDAGGSIRIRALAGGMAPMVFGSTFAHVLVTAAATLTPAKSWFAPGTVAQGTLLASCAALLAVVWSRLSIDPMTVANSMIKGAHYFPGVAPGTSTMMTVKRSVSGAGVTAALAAAPIAFLPSVVQAFGLPLSPIAGPSLVLVVVSVAESIRRVRTLMFGHPNARALPAHTDQ
jgi:preprotein translocase subunit SecY